MTRSDVAQRSTAKTDLARRFAPDFFIIGAMKAGTTTLNHYLDQSHDISMARIKETDYFLHRPEDGIGPDWYKSQFDLSFRCLGEASPNYTKHDTFPGVPERISAIAPDARFVFSARDPVARFASHYRHSWLHGHMRVAPQDLLASTQGRHMIECSRYAAQIEKYLNYFDRSQFLVVDFETICRDPQTVVNEITDFLGLPPTLISQTAARNTADHIARIPPFVRRAARHRIVRRIERYFPKSTRETLGRAISWRQPMSVPELGQDVLDAAGEMLREDSARFRDIAGLGFAQWCV